MLNSLLVIILTMEFCICNDVYEVMEICVSRELLNRMISVSIWFPAQLILVLQMAAWFL